MSVHELAALEPGTKVKVRLDNGYWKEGIVYSVKRLGAFVDASMRWANREFFLPQDIVKV